MVKCSDKKMDLVKRVQGGVFFNCPDYTHYMSHILISNTGIFGAAMKALKARNNQKKG